MVRIYFGKTPEVAEMKKGFTGFYEIDASRIKGKVLNVVFPKTVFGVQKVIRENLKIVPRGGGTGLRGGAVPQRDDTVLDMSKLNGISNLDVKRKIIEVEAGVVLDDLQEYLAEYGLEFPVNLLSSSACTLGGMIATNAFGSRVNEYWKISKWVMWIDVADSNGNLNRKGVTEISDYIGMEGITGVIVRAGLKVLPTKRRTASVITFENVHQLVDKAKELKREQDISGLEFFDLWISKKIGLPEGYNLLIEYENDGGDYNGAEYVRAMEFTKRAYEEVTKEGYLRIEDPKILVDKFVPLFEWFEARKIPVFGNIGVGVLHPCLDKDQERSIPEMMKVIKRFGGRVSSNFGIGILKKEFVEVIDRNILRNVKKRTDPKNKFNVGKIL
jgi:FAD/FMN-containing dehydrogenase